VRMEGRRVHFRCANRHRVGAGSSTGSSGLGNPLMARRLELLYPGRHVLEVEDEGGTYTVRLTVDLG
jgi:two-component system LytT family sensor kinase